MSFKRRWNTKFLLSILFHIFHITLLLMHSKLLNVNKSEPKIGLNPLLPQRKPFPAYPDLQAQVYDEVVLKQVAWLWHLCVPRRHSSARVSNNVVRLCLILYKTVCQQKNLFFYLVTRRLLENNMQLRVWVGCQEQQLLILLLCQQFCKKFHVATQYCLQQQLRQCSKIT